MPIKLPKSFARRKSSGNSLEEAETTRQPSFRVLDRNAEQGKSINDNAAPKRLNAESVAEDPDNMFAGSGKPLPKHRGSGGTDYSASSGRLYENSSSTQYSSSSTLPSSTDVPAHNDIVASHSNNNLDTQGSSISGALRAAGRTISFAGKMSRPSTATTPPRQSTTASKNKESTPSAASTASTATPPKLDQTLRLNGSNDDFSRMFDNMGKEDPPLSYPPTAYLNKGKERQTEADVGPGRPGRQSWGSQHSGEGLLSTFDAGQEEDDDIIPANNFRQSRTMPVPTTTHRSLERPPKGPDKGLRRSLIWADKREDSPVEDADAKIVRQSLLWNKESSQPLIESNRESVDMSNEASLFEGREPPIKNQFANLGYNGNQASSSVNGQPSHREREEAEAASQPRKVMTFSQFEQYRQQRQQQHQLRRANSDASKSDESADSDYDDEENEAEKTREAERQRRKQEAHLAVYRQQMMKVTGQQSPSNLSLPPANNSAPNLTPPASNGRNKSSSGKKNDGDEDEEIPLGILAAHGFPSRNRPPTRLASSSSIPNLRASTQPPHAGVGRSGSPAADQDTGNKDKLPAFAKNLPRDPYFGAGLVSHSNRESLAMGGGSPGPGPSFAPHPAGLVGVIATEERARAYRRGSPRQQAGIDHQPGGMTPTPGGIPRPYSTMTMNMPNGPVVQPPSATEQAQIQLSQQMSSMVQMQMQMMQQMMQMQQGAPGTPGPYPTPTAKNVPSPAGANASMRPVTMHGAGGLLSPPSGASQNDPRTLSMLNRNAPSPWNNSQTSVNPPGISRPNTSLGQNYAPSIAASDRSNIGKSPRYRPMSTAQLEQGTKGRASTFTSSTLKPWDNVNHKPRSHSSLSPSRHPLQEKTNSEPIAAAGPATSNGRPTATKSARTASDDDEDDEKAWAEMMKKRENKKNGWKMKKESASLNVGVLSPVH